MSSAQTRIIAEIAQLESDLTQARTTLAGIKRAKLKFGVLALIILGGGMLYVLFGDVDLDALSLLDGLVGVVGGATTLVLLALEWRERRIKRRVARELEQYVAARKRLAEQSRDSSPPPP